MLKQPRQQSGQEYVRCAYDSIEALKEAGNTITILWYPASDENELLKTAKEAARKAMQQNAVPQRRFPSMTVVAHSSILSTEFYLSILFQTNTKPPSILTTCSRPRARPPEAERRIIAIAPSSSLSSDESVLSVLLSEALFLSRPLERL
jgi:hypothetical protein